MATPNKFKKSFCDQAAVLTKLGATDAELADFFKVSLRTLHRWKAMYADFANALRLGKHEADERVTRSLFQRAVGYTAPETHIAVHQGKAIATELIKHYPPDTTACIFWLKNRRPEEWRENFDGERVDKDKLNRLLEAVEGRIAELEEAPGQQDRPGSGAKQAH